MATIAKPAPPNPGTESAIAAGRTCPVIDNHHGAGVPRPDGSVDYWYTSGCPVHTSGN